MRDMSERILPGTQRAKRSRKLAVGGVAVVLTAAAIGLLPAVASATTGTCQPDGTSGACYWYTNGYGSNSPGEIAEGGFNGENEFNAQPQDGDIHIMGWLRRSDGSYVACSNGPLHLTQGQWGVLCTAVIDGTHEHAQETGTDGDLKVLLEF
jgi:hypothetical protein